MESVNGISILAWLLPSARLERRLWPLLLGLAYILAIRLLGGLRWDHVLIGMLPLLDFYNERTRAFLRGFLPFILTGVIYDSMRYFYWQGVAGHIHVADPYFRDLRFFGISEGGRQVTVNEFFARHTAVALDLACGFAYLFYVGETFVAAFYFFLSGRRRVFRTLAWSFFVVNLLGFATYYAYPAAPPWYVSRYGLFDPPRMDVHAFAAATQRFDRILGTHFFDSMYSRGVDVYGAYPSLHVAYPLLTFLAICTQPGLKRLRAPAFAFYLLMCLSATYLQHHYVVDVLLGTLYAVVAWIAVKAGVDGREGDSLKSAGYAGRDHGSERFHRRASSAVRDRSRTPARGVSAKGHVARGDR